VGAWNTTGDAISGGNETAAVGGDVIASETGNGSADGGNGTGGSAYANGGFAKSGDAKVVNVASVDQWSEQEMKVWDNDKWSSWSFSSGFHKKHDLAL
jgi:hypothetical protein